MALELCSLTGHSAEEETVRVTRDRLLLLQLDARRAFERSLRVGEEGDLEHAQRLLHTMSPSKPAKTNSKRALEFNTDGNVPSEGVEASEVESLMTTSAESAAEVVAKAEEQPNHLDPIIVSEIMR